MVEPEADCPDRKSACGARSTSVSTAQFPTHRSRRQMFDSSPQGGGRFCDLPSLRIPSGYMAVTVDCEYFMASR